MTLAETLRKAIIDSGRSAYALQQETGVDASVISRFLHEERDLRLETAGKLAAALGMTLITSTDERKSTRHRRKS